MKKILIFGLAFIFEGVGLYCVHSGTLRSGYSRVINHPIASGKTMTIKSIGKKLLGDVGGKP